MRISDWSSDLCSSDLPTLDADKHSAPLVPIRGSVTVPRNRPPGCVFATRCEFKREGLCTSDTIPMGLAPDSQRHRVRCARDRKSVVQGKSVSVRVDLGGLRFLK